MVQSQSAVTTILEVVPAIPTARFGIFPCTVEATTSCASVQSNAQLHRQLLESQQRPAEDKTIENNKPTKVLRLVYARIVEQDCLLAGYCCDVYVRF